MDWMRSKVLRPPVPLVTAANHSIILHCPSHVLHTGNAIFKSFCWADFNLQPWQIRDLLPSPSSAVSVVVLPQLAAVGLSLCGICTSLHSFHEASQLGALAVRHRWVKVGRWRSQPGSSRAAALQEAGSQQPLWFKYIFAFTNLAAFPQEWFGTLHLGSQRGCVL